MRSLLSSLALALALVLTGCDATTDAAAPASSSAPCYIEIIGPSEVDGYSVTDFSVEVGEGCSPPTWTIDGAGTLSNTTGHFISVTAGPFGSFTLTATTENIFTNRPSSTSLTVTVNPSVYPVAATSSPNGIALDWSGYEGCGQPGYTYSVRRLVLSGPPLPPGLANFPASGCSVLDDELYISSDPNATRIRYLVRTFLNGVRITTGQSNVVHVATGPDF